jgi:hypothetical protein
MYDRNASRTICAQCSNLIVPAGSRSHWYHWLCVAKQWPPEFNPVTGQHDKHPPHRYCRDLNGGDCPQFEPGPNDINRRATPEGEII